MKKTIAFMTIIASSILFADSSNSIFIKKIDRASNTSSFDKLANGTFFELKGTKCYKIKTKGASRGTGQAAQVHSKKEVDLSNCKSDLIADKINKKLKENGLLYFEINQYLGDEMIQLMEDNHFKEIELKQDVFGENRMLKGRKRED